jgi:hypothetical protein
MSSEYGMPWEESVFLGFEIGVLSKRTLWYEALSMRTEFRENNL